MKFFTSFGVLFACLLFAQNGQSSTAEKESLCKTVDFDQNIVLCSPEKDWIYMGDPQNKKTGHVWMHKKREGEKINSFVLTIDDENSFNDFQNYIRFAKSEFQRLNISVNQEKKIDDNFTILKMVTPDKKVEFFQAYRVLGGKTWTMSCMGPNQAIIDRDCPEFIKSFSIKK